MSDDLDRPELCTCDQRHETLDADGRCPVCGGLPPWPDADDPTTMGEEPLSVDAIHPDAPHWGADGD